MKFFFFLVPPPLHRNIQFISLLTKLSLKIINIYIHHLLIFSLEDIKFLFFLIFRIGFNLKQDFTRFLYTNFIDKKITNHLKKNKHKKINI